MVLRLTHAGAEPQLQLFTRRNGEPLVEERGAETAHTLNIGIRECAWSKFVELFDSQEHAGTPLGIEQANHPLYLGGFGGKRAACAFARGIVHVPPFSDQAEEATPITKSGLDSIMSQVVQDEMRRVSGLLLPGYRTIVTGTPHHNC